MKHLFSTLSLSLLSAMAIAQGPAVTSWLQNTSETGTYYMSGNSTPIDNGVLYNCQLIEYSDDFVYAHTNGIPAYPTGPFSDGNPSQAESQDAIFKIPLNPTPNDGTPDVTVGGNIGVFINGVALFDFRDGVGWNSTTNSLCGGPGNPPCPGGPMALTDWSRDAIPAEMEGFDCSKAHPAMGNYHHHQNPSAFKLDLEVVSDICNLYDADGLYAIDEDAHSPLLGFAYDGYPIYGAYGYENNDGTGDIVRIKSGYQLRDISERTTHANGSSVDQGPDVSDTYWLGYFREDYEYIAHPGEEDYLDIHNGRECITPDYPDGTYAYFATVDENWNSAYPYIVGPTFNGHYENRSVNSVTEETTVYVSGTTGLNEIEGLDINIFPNPASDLIAIQIAGMISKNLTIELLDISGKLVDKDIIKPGSTIAYFDVQAVYSGTYVVRIYNDNSVITQTVIIARD